MTATTNDLVTPRSTRGSAARAARQRLCDAVLRLNRARDLKRSADEAGKVEQAAVLAAFARLGVSSVEVDHDDLILVATVVAPERTSVDWAKVKRRVGAEVWEMMTTPQVDRAKVDHLVKINALSPQVLDACASVESSVPFVKITVRRPHPATSAIDAA